MYARQRRARGGQRQVNFSRTRSINEALERTLTRERLAKYLSAAKQDLDRALTLYEDNTKISESFYTPLQCLEVCLRNSIDIQMTQTYGDYWFDNKQLPLGNDSRRMILDARERLKKDRRPISRGRVIAELKFAFWVGLMGPGYDATIWRGCIHRAFRSGNKSKPRSLVHGRFNAIRRFRNRIAHHEPIFDRPCIQIHEEIIEATAWMCPRTAEWAGFHSRFETVISTLAPITSMEED